MIHHSATGGVCLKCRALAPVWEATLGYGMFRRSDEGCAIPSLGIAIHPAEQGRGLGKAFMHFLHAAAQRRGVSRIRLQVDPMDSRAVADAIALCLRSPDLLTRLGDAAYRYATAELTITRFVDRFEDLLRAARMGSRP